MKSWSDYVGQEVAGRWRLQSLLGVGSFGAVYAVDASRTGIPLVVRLLDPKIGGESAFDPSVFTGFRHAGAVEVSDVGTFGETRYLVMPQALGTRLKVRDPWACDQVLEFVRQVGAVLIEFQKQFDLQHLHLHPGNVFVEVRPDQKPRFQLADLGLASQVGVGELLIEAIRERRTTPECLSPEQLQGHVPSGQSDVYAFGAMLFQLLSGVPPFPYTGESLSAYARHVAKSSPPRFRDVSVQLDVDSYIESFVLRCLSKSPASRPNSIQELVDSYELAYLDFQIRTLSGMKSPFHEAKSKQDSSISQTPNSRSLTGTTNSSISPSIPAKPTTFSTSSRAESAAPAASDLLPAAPLSDSRLGANKTGPVVLRKDSTCELPPAPARPPESTRAILQMSDSILEDVDSKLDLWSGLKRPDDSKAVLLTDEALREEDSSDVRLTDEALREEDSSDVRLTNEALREEKSGAARFTAETLHEVGSNDMRFTDEALREEDSFYEPGSLPSEPPKPTTAPYRSQSPYESWPSESSSPAVTAQRDKHTLSPVLVPTPVPRSEAMDLTPMPHYLLPDSTVAMQQQYLDQLVAPPVPQTDRSRPSRQTPAWSGPPKIVTALFAAVVVLAVGLLIYGNVSAARLRREVARRVEDSRYKDAKDKLQSVQLLTGVWLDRNNELQKVLTAGLDRARGWQKSSKLCEAVKETGLIDEAFAGEQMTDVEAAKKIREEIAKTLRQRVLDIAKQGQPFPALDEIQSDLAKAFAKVAQESKKTSEFDAARLQQDVFAVGLDLARTKSNAGNLDEALLVLEKWSRAFQEETNVSEEQKRELQEYLCEIRMRKGMADAARESDAVPPRFADAIMSLNRLEKELDAGRCATRKPDVLRKRGEVFHAWAESRQGVESDVKDHFANAIADFSAVHMSLGQPPPREQVAALLENVLSARAATYLARGRWHESRAKSQPAALMLAIQDFKSALADTPQQPEPRQRLAVIRGHALRDGQEAFQLAQLEVNLTAADDHYCESERFLSVAIAACISKEDDSIARSAHLWRGLARSSRRVPNFSGAVADLATAVVDVTELHLSEIAEQTMSDVEPEDRELRLRMLFAVGRSELAWLLSTWPIDRDREAAHGEIIAVDQALKAIQTLATLKLAIDNRKLNPSDSGFREALFKNECFASRAHLAALADRGQFGKIQTGLRGLQGLLSLKTKDWQSTLSRDLDEMWEKSLKNGQPFRSSYSAESARNCVGQK